MIRTSHAARRLVATLAAVLLAGIIGLGAVAGLSSSDRRSNNTASSVDHEGGSQPRLTVAKTVSDDHILSVDLPAGTLEVVPALGAAVLAAVVLALVCGQIGTATPVPAGRAPPRR